MMIRIKMIKMIRIRIIAKMTRTIKMIKIKTMIKMTRIRIRIEVDP